MSPDHLCEEGLAHQEEIQIPFNVIVFSATLLITLYGICFNAHFYFFRGIAKVLFWIYDLGSRSQHALFYWYFLLHFNCHIRPQKTLLDSTQGRDHELNQQPLLEIPAPYTKVLVDIRPQIKFLQLNSIGEIFDIAHLQLMPPTFYPHSPI